MSLLPRPTDPVAAAKWDAAKRFFDDAIELMVARHLYVTQFGVLPDEVELRRVQTEVHAMTRKEVAA